MLHRISTQACVAVALLLTAASVAGAQNLAQVYRFKPAPGNGPAVQAALAEHTAWRAEQGDPWSWTVLQEVQGPNFGDWIVVSGGHTWEDLDAYSQGFGPRGGQHFTATVTPLLESITNEILIVDPNLTNSPQSGEYPLVRVTNWKLVPARQAQFNQTIARIIDSYPQGGDEYLRSYLNVMVGGDLPAKRSVQWFRDWSDLANAPTPGTSVVEAYGQEEATRLFQALSESIRSNQTYVLRAYPEMAVEGGM